MRLDLLLHLPPIWGVMVVVLVVVACVCGEDAPLCQPLLLLLHTPPLPLKV